MEKKKISAKDVAYIQGYKKTHFRDKLITHTIEEDGSYIIIKRKIRLLVKIILTLPAILLLFIDCVWSEGLKNFIELLKNLWNVSDIHEYQNFYTNSRYSRMKKVLDKR